MNQNFFRVALLIVFGVFLAIGVILFAMQSTNSGTTAAGPVTMWGTIPGTVMEAVIKEAAYTDPSFDLLQYQEVDPATYQSTLTEALANGQGPDLIIMTDETAIRDEGKVYLIPPDQISPAQYFDTFLDAASVFVAPGGIEALPLLVDPVMLYWNRDMLAVAGFTSPPRTWEDVLAITEAVVKKDEQGSLEQGGIAFGDYQNIRNAKQVLVTLIMQAGNPIVARNEEGRLVAVLSPEQGNNGTLTEKALTLYTRFSNPASAEYSWSTVFPEAQIAFAQEQVAMYVGYASERADIMARNPNLNFSVAAIPQYEGQRRPMTTARVYGLAVPRTAKNPSGGYSMAMSMTSPTFAMLLSNSTGMATALRDVAVAADGGTAPTSQTLQNILRSNPKSYRDLVYFQAGIARSWLDPNPLSTSRIFYDMIDSVITGAQSASVVGARAHQQIQALLGL